MPVKLTPEMWKALGFKKLISNGGYARYYHRSTYFPDLPFHHPKGGTISDGSLSFTISTKTIKGDCPDTLEDLYEIINAYFKAGYERDGIFQQQSKLRELVGLDD